MKIYNLSDFTKDNISSLSELRTLLPNLQEKVLLDFYADWCWPCKVLIWTLHNLEQTNSNEDFDVVKINVEIFSNLSSIFKIRSIPTLVTLKWVDPQWMWSWTPYKEQILEMMSDI